jgi:prepilin-type N-terminal cleavage/methylation domain-containing protein
MTNLQQRRKEAGFTLVELAIVMIIIGLLIGGILKGQELVANAQVTATVAQIKGLDGAISTFRDKYSAMPGDMLAPDVRLRDCGAAPCNNPGNGDGRILEGAILAVPTVTQERLVAFTHMAAADLISGVDINGEARFGSALPEAKIGGGFWIGFSPTQNLGGGINNVRPGHYLVLNGLVAAVAAGSTTGITATQAAQIDRKLDDGDAASGDVQSTGSNCRTAGVYQEADVSASCSVTIRVQG